jgi:hypothetical protein
MEQPTRRTRDEEPARQRRLNGKAIEPGADHGAGNRGAPRGARAHKQPDSASDARQRNAAAKLATRSRLPSEPTFKSGLFRVSFFGAVFLRDAVAAFPAAAVVGGCGTAAANFVEPCGVHRWTLRRFLRHPSWELAANIVGKIVGGCGIAAAAFVWKIIGTCGNGRWRVVDQPLTPVRGRASLPFSWARHLRHVPAFVPVCGTFPHHIGDQPGEHFAEHSTRKTAISLAAFAAPPFGLPPFLLVEQTCEHALNGGVTLF